MTKISSEKWNQWLDGKEWRLERGRDYWGDTDAFLMEALTAASERGLSVGSTKTMRGVAIMALTRKGGPHAAPIGVSTSDAPDNTFEDFEAARTHAAAEPGGVPFETRVLPGD